MKKQRIPTREEYVLWNDWNQKFWDATRGLGCTIMEQGSDNLVEVHGVLEDLVLAHIRAAELAARHRHAQAGG